MKQKQNDVLVMNPWFFLLSLCMMGIGVLIMSNGV